MGSYFSKPWDPSTGIPDLSGKVIIVTGAKFVIDADAKLWSAKSRQTAQGLDTPQRRNWLVTVPKYMWQREVKPKRMRR